MKTMFRSLLLVAGITCLTIATPAEVLLNAHFSESSGSPGWSRTTFGDSIFHNSWSINSSVAADAGNWFARYAINVSQLPVNDATRWIGGFYAPNYSIVSLPANWQLSFDVSLPAAESMQVNFLFNPNTGTTPPFLKSTVMTFWITPPETGWQHIVINQDTPHILSERSAGPALGISTSLTISMASHDALGNAQTIAQVGTHTFDLDNIILQTIPEPTGIVWIGLVIIGLMRNYNRT